MYRWPGLRAPRDASFQLAHLLDDVTRYIHRYVILTTHQVVATTLWVAHCHVFAVAETTPYLNVTSAVKQCGKTRLLEVLEPIVPTPWLTGRVSAAVLTRKVDAETPTLLLDESDAAFAHRSEYAEALRSILNSGYRRSGVSSLCVGQGAEISYRDFSTFCPKAIAGIGALPDTVTGPSVLRSSGGRPTSESSGFASGTRVGRERPCGGTPLTTTGTHWTSSGWNPTRSVPVRTQSLSVRQTGRVPLFQLGWGRRHRPEGR